MKKRVYVDHTSEPLFLLTYIAETKNLSKEKVLELLNESGLNGGEIVETWIELLRKEGKMQGKLEVAIAMLQKGFEFGIVSEISGFPIEEVEKIAETVH